MVNQKYQTGYKRFWAAVLDGILLVPAALLISFLAYATNSTGMTIFWNCLNSLIPLAYSVYMHYRFGQTLGKRAYALLVVDVSETRILTFRQALLRDSLTLVITIAGIVYLLISLKYPGNHTEFRKNWWVNESPYLWLTLLELLTMLSNSKRRAIHDYLAGSVVIDLDVISPDRSK